MGRLIRQISFAAAFGLLLPVSSGAQTLQNSGSGELNMLGLDLTQATVTLNRLPMVDAANSSVTVDPPVVAADGIAFSTITVTLRNGSNQPLAGRTVTLASSRGVLDVIVQPLKPTDVSGVTTAEMRSVNSGLTQVLATDVQDAVLLNDQPEVGFSRGEVLQLTKTVSPDRASIGDIVTYTIEIQNTTVNTIGSVRINDTPAPVLAYVAGTARLDGAAIADPVQGSPMYFDIGDVLSLGATNGTRVADPAVTGYRAMLYTRLGGAAAQPGAQWRGQRIFGLASLQPEGQVNAAVMAVGVEVFPEQLLERSETRLPARPDRVHGPEDASRDRSPRDAVERPDGLWQEDHRAPLFEGDDLLECRQPEPPASVEVGEAVATGDIEHRVRLADGPDRLVAKAAEPARRPDLPQALATVDASRVHRAAQRVREVASGDQSVGGPDSPAEVEDGDLRALDATRDPRQQRHAQRVHAEVARTRPGTEHTEPQGP